MSELLPPPEPGSERYNSPGELLSIQLATQAEHALDGREGVIENTLDDGSRVRTLTQGELGSTLSETTTPDGVKTYQYDSYYMQADDRGLTTYKWISRSDKLQIDSNFELGGKSSEEEEMNTYGSLLQSNIDYLASRFPERGAVTRGSRVSRVLSKFRTK